MDLLDLLIAPAHAQAAAPASGTGGMLSTLLLPIVFIAVMYFLMIRPQMKRQKEHRGMLDKLQRGDEIITSGGIAGTVSEIGDNFVTVEISNGVQVRVQRGAIANVLPKGTLKSA
ncbi:MAG TPA: preprotein translocase subunit YajC [Lysobacter sp.]|jgi:preprotein translocase subunit YajC|nr:preprotein translocase subunit YajC [Lysobacter sp.]